MYDQGESNPRFFTLEQLGLDTSLKILDLKNIK